MTKKQCSEKVVDKDTLRTRPCQSIVSVQRDGKWYCGTHDPEKKRNRRPVRCLEDMTT